MKKKIKEFFVNFWMVINRSEMRILPGQLAFFFVLSVVPIITMISYGALFLNLSTDFISNFITKAFSQDITDLVMPIISGHSVDIKFFISVIVGFFIASNGADSMIVSSNTIYNIKNKNYFIRRIKALVMTFILVLLFIFLLVVPVFGNKIVALFEYVNVNQRVTDTIVIVFNILKGPLSLLIIFIFLKIIYTMAPDRKIPSSYVNYGSIFTSVLWYLSTMIYSYYIQHFARYDLFYGGLANIVILMLWVYLLAYIYTIGLALNYRDEQVKLEKTAKIKIVEE